jgi:urease accessory protein
MLRATAVKRAGTWTGPPADVVVLDREARHRRRHTLVGRSGLAFLLDLPQAVFLRDGDGLALEDGRIVAVEAAPELLFEITCQDPLALLRVAWHLGNRHLPTEIRGDRLRIRADHVIADMVRGLGATVTVIKAPFDPEGGAYDQDHRHNHGHHEQDSKPGHRHAGS